MGCEELMYDPEEVCIRVHSSPAIPAVHHYVVVTAAAGNRIIPENCVRWNVVRIQ